jgi:alpha-mannosidase
MYASAMIDQDASEQTIKKSIDAAESMLDELGIYQHHDAVAGTARQHVADDYTKRLYNAMNKNFNATADLIDNTFKRQTGMSANSTWNFCQRTNGTYLDCPISDYQLHDGKEIFVSV